MHKVLIASLSKIQFHILHELLLLLLLSRFSRVQLCATLYTVAYQAPLCVDLP